MTRSQGKSQKSLFERGEEKDNKALFQVSFGMG